MAQLKDSVVQGSLRVTDTTYTTNLNLSSASASLSIFTDANKNLVTKSSADAWSALGGDESGQHPDSYFIKAITSTDEVMVRFNSTAGQVQSSRMSINDNGLITVSYNGQYPGDTQFKNAAGTIVGERWLDQGNKTNVTSPRFYWRVWRPKATADTGVNTQYEQFRLPAASSGTAANATYEILTSKSKVTIAQGGTGLSSADPHKVLIGPNSTAAAAPTWRTIVAADLPTATTSALGVMSVSTGLSVSSGAVSVSYGTAANTALQGNATLVTLNGTNKSAASVASFYAPTAAGTSGQYLKSTAGTPEWATFSSSTVGLGNVSNNSKLNGSAGTKGDMIYWSDKDTPARLGIGTANHILIATANGPVWSRNAHIIDESGSSVANKRDELVLGNNTASSSNGSSFGRLALYSENTAGTYLVSASGTAWKTATLQAKDGTIAYTADITSAIQALDGNLNSTTPGAGKTLTAFSQTDGKVSATFGNISITASQAGLGNVSNNANLNKITGTKGDMIYWSAADTPSRLAIGTEGQTLWATASGPAWKKAKDINKLVWTSTISYDVDNDEFVKSSTASAAWDAQVYSTHGYKDGCYVSFTAKNTTSDIMVGLNTDPTANANWTSIDYCWYLTPSTSNCNIRESGGSAMYQHAYAAGDNFRIEYSDSRIKYYHNGYLWRTVNLSAGTKLYLDSSIYTKGGAIKDLEFGPITQTSYLDESSLYYGENGSKANEIVWESTDASLGLPAFKYGNYHFGTNSFGIPDTAITIETTTNGTAASPTWATATNAWYTAARKRSLFNHNETQIPVGNLGAFDYWNNTAGTAFTYNNNGTNETHYAAPITAGMGVRITANFESCARRFYMSCIETYWRAYIHNCKAIIEGYCLNTNTWTTIGTFNYNNTDTRRFYRLGGNKYIGGTVSNASYFNRLRWTLIVTQVNSSTSTNKRYAPSIAAINIYGPGMPGNVNNTEYRFAYEMARHGQPIYVTDYNATGAARVSTGSLYIGDNLLNTAANTEKWTNVYIGNDSNVNAVNVHSQGRIYLYSAATAAHVIVGSSTTTEYTHTLPNNTGTLVSLSGGTVKGSASKPIYVPATGIVTECSTYAGGTKVTLNGTAKGGADVTIFAPTAGGTAGQILISAGNAEPAWNGALTLAGSAAANYTATIHGKLIGSSYNYGATLPSSPTAGQIFFQTSNPVYELPTGGTTGQALVKASNTNRDVKWGGPYLPLTGGTMTGALTAVSTLTISAINTSTDGGRLLLARPARGKYCARIDNYNNTLRIYGSSDDSTWVTGVYVNLSTGRLLGAAWNDYAEFRKDNVNEILEMGRCVCEVGDGSLRLTKYRLEYGCEIISDTYGFAIGEDKDKGYNTPVASSGRVLAYPFEELEIFRSHIGWPVCSGPNGTVSIMTEDEERRYPSRIIGTISEIPSYEEWGTGKVKVNGRVWIRIR